MESCESLSEAMRSRALKIGSKLEKDEDRDELARRLGQVNERARQAEVEADQSLLRAEQQVTQIEHGLSRAVRSAREEQSKTKAIKKAERKLDHFNGSSSILP